jgi:hypothetical protein
MAKSAKKHTETPSASFMDSSKISEKEKMWIEAVYSDSIPLSLTWKGRVEEVTRRLGYTISDNTLRLGSQLFFIHNIKAEAYWSMVMMYHNVCDSIRTPEASGEGKASNENSSYKVKIENSLKLKPVMDEIKRLAEDLFKKNEVAEADFNAGKLESDFGEGALEAALREVNNGNEGDNIPAKKRKAAKEA